MMKLSCKDLDPSLECDFEARGNTAPEVAKKLIAHVKVAHPEKLEDASEAEMTKMMESKVHS